MSRSRPASPEPDHRALIEQGFGLMCMHDSEGVLTWVNQAIATLLGYEREEMVGRSLADFVDDPASLEPYLENLAAEGEDRGWIEARTRSGELRYLQFHNRVVTGADGSSYVVGHAQDVTGLVETSEVLREAKDHLERVVAANPTVIFSIEPTPDFHATYISPNVEVLTGYPPDNFVRRGFWIDCVHPEDRDRVAAGLQKALELGSHSHEYRFLHADGLYRRLRSRHTVLRDAVGEPLEISGQVVDVTSPVGAGLELERFFELTADLLSIRGMDGYLKRVNDSFGEILGYTDDELLTRPIRSLLHEDDVGVAERALGRAGPGSKVTFEERWRCADGSYRTLVWRMMPYPDDGIAYAAARDVTESRARESELRRAMLLADEANRMKGEFLANMSHEIRTPMNGVIGMTELALETNLTDQQREYLQMVLNSAEALLETINSILDFSKIEAGKMELEAIDFTLWETVTGALKPLALTARNKKVELLYDEGADVPERLRGDPGRLRQALINLVGNAVKFTHSGTVRLVVTRASAPPEEVRLHFDVIDTGIGIPRAKMDRIMRPFGQADGSMSRRFGGTGLGLAITKGLVEMMGGQLHVESEEGTGSTFSFTARFLEARAGDRPAVPTGTLAGLRVLAVDDLEANRRILEAFARRMGMSVTTAGSGAEALQALARCRDEGAPIDLALIDCQMPEMGGFELAEHIRADGRYRDLVLVAFTAAGRPGDGARCEELGISSYLLKPLAPAELRDALLMTLSRDPTRPRKGELVTRHSLREARSGLRILLAEDNRVNQQLAVHMLERFGHRVQLATNGRAAVEAWEREQFDVILMDIQMPEMDGVEATRRIRGREAEGGPGHRTPIVAMTAHAMVGDRERFLAAGMDDYISKPISRDRLREVLRGIQRPDQPPEPRAVATDKPSTANGRTAPSFDRRVLMERTESDVELIRALVGVFDSDHSSLLGAIRAALDVGDAGALERAAHTIKGALGVFGAEPSRARAERMERMGRDGAVEQAAPELDELTAEVDALRADLQGLLVELDATSSG